MGGRSVMEREFICQRGASCAHRAGSAERRLSSRSIFPGARQWAPWFSGITESRGEQIRVNHRGPFSCLDLIVVPLGNRNRSDHALAPQSHNREDGRGKDQRREEFRANFAPAPAGRSGDQIDWWHQTSDSSSARRPVTRETPCKPRSSIRSWSMRSGSRRSKR